MNEKKLMEKVYKTDKELLDNFKNVVLGLRRCGFTKKLIRDHFKTFMDWNLEVPNYTKPADFIIHKKKEKTNKFQFLTNACQLFEMAEGAKE